MPPVGNEDASGSPWISSLPENSASEVPSSVGLKNESCFSAVRPVSGWNTWVKCVAPFSSAHSFIASATASAVEGSSASPRSSVFWSCLKTSFGSRERCTASENTFWPYGLLAGWVRSTDPMPSPFGDHCAAVTFFWRILAIVLCEASYSVRSARVAGARDSTGEWKDEGTLIRASGSGLIPLSKETGLEFAMRSVDTLRP